MAITTNKKILKTANAGIPNAYVPAVLPTITPKIRGQWDVQFPCLNIENASELTALANILVALQAELTTVLYDTILHFDTADNFTVNVIVTKIERTRIVENDLKPGADYFKIYMNYEYS